jgi:hypothetical protein
MVYKYSLLIHIIQWDAKSKWNLKLPYHMQSSLLPIPTMSQCHHLNPHHTLYFIIKLLKTYQNG